MSDSRRALALRVLWENYGRWYKWGGDDPSAYDCSGLALEVLKSVGLWPRHADTTANGLFKHFHMHEIQKTQVQPGCLVFWLRKDDSVATHVEMVIQVEGSEIYAMGASGGGSKTITIADAIRENAFIKVRPVKSRRGSKAFVDPFKEVRRDV